MLFRRDTPIQKKLMSAMLLTSGAVLLLTCTALFVYDLYSFRQVSISQLSMLGRIIATNSTAALAFDDNESANEILSAVKADPHIVSACLYDEAGDLFAFYPLNLQRGALPDKPEAPGFAFTDSHITGFVAVAEGDKILGTLYLQSDMEAIYQRFGLYGMIVIAVIILSSLLAYILSINLQRKISKPIMALAETAKTISLNRDYSIRANKGARDEIGALSDGFNDMLTHIEKMERSLRETNQDLERRVEERTTELATTNKELESFTYSVSHDLRAPLRIINGYADILAEEYNSKLDDEGRRLTEIITSNAKRMGQLIDDLLNLSRFGKTELKYRDVDMTSLARSVLEEMPDETKQRADIKLDTLPASQGDHNLLRQVWINFISNALKYSSKKEKPHIEIGSIDQKNETVYYVKDNGTGFDMLYVDKLFGVFQRLHKDTEFEGTGVGLAIVYRIVARHNGKVWAEGEIDKGATFYFSLPKKQ